MKVITKVLVGSRLHGLDTPSSDYDWRGIHLHDVREILSPFKTLKNTDWIEGDEDNTSYELADFCKMATHGNATILEVFFSDQVASSSPLADEMRANWRKFIDTDKFVMASKGYAQNQLNKMYLFEDDGQNGQRRTGKFVVSYMRVMWQCAEFLRTGQFKCRIEEGAMKQFMLKAKSDWKADYVQEATEWFSKLQAEVSLEWSRAEKMKPDIEWIEDFIYRAYTRESL
jgi:predicted nucleotidyltransferase